MNGVFDSLSHADRDKLTEVKELTFADGWHDDDSGVLYCIVLYCAVRREHFGADMLQEHVVTACASYV